MHTVGLLTFHTPINYGAALQSVALFQTINSLPNVKCKIIDYHSAFFKQKYGIIDISRIKSLKGALWQIVLIPSNIKKFKRFRSFIRRNCFMTDELSREGIACCEKEFDSFVTGSDQVFSLHNNGHDFTYFLDFVETKRRVAYAASFGDTLCFEDKEEIVVDLLKKFSCLSIRETYAVETLNNKYHIISTKVLDPTLLLSSDQWNDVVCDKSKFAGQKYLFLFYMIKDKNIVEQMSSLAHQIAEKYSLKIYTIGGSLHKRIQNTYYYNDCGPDEFVDLIKNASYIVTNSFHATAFSIIYKKNFYSYVPHSKYYTSRVRDLLLSINLDSRVFFDCASIHNIEDIDYELTAGLLEKQIKSSKEFLSSALEV